MVELSTHQENWWTRKNTPVRSGVKGIVAVVGRVTEVGVFGSEQEFVNTCVFAGFLSDRLLGPPMLPHLLHVRCRQCFPTFCGSFHVRTWPQLLSGHNPLKGRLKRGSPGTEQLFPNREPVCPKASGRPADPSVKDRIVDIPQ